MQAADQAGVGVGLVEGEEHLVLLLGEVELEGEAGVVVVLVMGPQEVDGAEGNTLPTLEPSCPLALPTSSREYGDGHALSEEGSLLGQVD